MINMNGQDVIGNEAFIKLFSFYWKLLTPKQQRYFQLYFLADLSLREIANQYHVSQQTVWERILNAKKQLEIYENQLGLAFAYDQRELIYDNHQLTPEQKIKSLQKLDITQEQKQGKWWLES